MPNYALRNLGRGNIGVSLPKEDLIEEGVLDEDGTVPDDQRATVDRMGNRTYLVRLSADDGSLPDVRETDVVERLVGQRLMEMDAFSGQPAD